MVVVSGIVINNRIVSNSDGEKHNHNNNTFRLRTTHTYTHRAAFLFRELNALLASAVNEQDIFSGWIFINSPHCVD